ncbi:MAG TPA: DUF4232 domain-containing protein [Solirubrobacteraceae bacterium]|nr:DUF4232 domain-containing protein [Solirubrobacteraceae bacterium]
MTNRLSHARLRALGAGGIAAAALAVAFTVATSATAATPAQASCTGISFSVLHNDQSGGVILPAGKYTVSSPNLGCKPASNFFTTFLNKYNGAIPGWKGKAIAKGWGTYTKNNSNTQFTVKWSKAKGGGSGNSCTTSALKVSLGPANGTAGTTFYPLKFVNTSKTSCTMSGYPGVSAVTSSGKQIGNAAKRIQTKFRTVTLAPGKQQSASIGIVDAGNFPAASCKPVTAAGLKVFPPNQGKSVILNKKFSTCSSTATTSLTIRPVK